MATLSTVVRAAALALVVLIVAGCGSRPEPPESTASTPVSSSASPTPTSSALAFTLDDTASFPDGLEVSTGGSEVRQVLAGETGADSSGGQVVVFSIVISNGTEAAYDPRSAVISASYGAANNAAPMIADSNAQLQSGFNESIPQGEEATALVGFAIPAAGLAKVTVTVALNDEENNPVSFSGEVKKL